MLTRSSRLLVGVRVSPQTFQLIRSFAKSTDKKQEEKKFTFARPFKGHRLDALPENHTTTTKEELLGFYKQMHYFRRLEIVADNLYKDRKIRGFCHLYDGQEAVLSGIEAALTRKDSIITAYRNHCHASARGDTGEQILAELMGRKTGSSKGKGGSMHFYNVKNNYFGGNGIVGAQVPVGAGLGFAHKYKKDGSCAVAMYGDGASNQGQIFEAANMAYLWKLPVVFICENNNYGMGTSTSRSSMNTAFYTRGDMCAGLWIDGQDVLAMKKGMEFAANYARSGKGPIFVEANTYRYHGHSMSDPGVSYRTKEEIAQIRAQMDPIEMAGKRLIEAGWATPEELKAIEKDVRKTVAAEQEKAEAAPFPDVKETFTEIYADAPPPYIRTVDPAQSLHTTKY